jgi:TrmH family RNA methyltransferase
MGLTKNKVKEIRSLLQKKFRDETGFFLIEGLRMVQEASGSDFRITEAYHTPGFLGHAEAKGLLTKLKKRGAALVPVTDSEMESITDTVTSQGIAAVLRRREFPAGDLVRAEGPRSVLVALDAVSDPGNLGSIIRTADWFGVNGMLLGRHCVELYNPKVLRATMGGIFHLPIAENVDLPATLSRAKESGYSIYVTDVERGTHFDRAPSANKSIVVFGNEAWGVSESIKGLADVRLMIRRYGSGESLNVGVACGIILSAMHRLDDGGGAS